MCFKEKNTLADGELWVRGRQEKMEQRLGVGKQWVGVVVMGMEKSGWIQEQFERKRVW